MTDVQMTEPLGPSDLSVVVINLMKGPVYRDTHEKPWALLLELRGQVSDYVSVLGLQVVVDESEGYAYLRSVPADDGAVELPRLVARRALSFHTSILLALLRKRLAEFDASSSESRLMLTREQIVEMFRLYLPPSTNEARVVDNIDTNINRSVRWGSCAARAARRISSKFAGSSRRTSTDSGSRTSTPGSTSTSAS